MASRRPADGEEGLRAFFWPLHLSMHLGIWVLVVAFLSVAAAVLAALFLDSYGSPAGYMQDLVGYYLEQAPSPAFTAALGDKVVSLFLGLPGMADAATSFAAKGSVSGGGLVLDRRELVLVVVYAIELFAVRLTLLGFAAPALLLLVAIALVDGLVARYVRRECGGHESATRHTRAKRLLRMGLIPCVALVWLVVPFRIPFGAFFLPVILITAILVWVMAKYFKKYL